MDEGHAFARGLVALGDALTRLGVPVVTSSLATAGEALATVDPGDREAVYWALHGSLLTHRSQEPAFDAVFEAFWTGDVVALQGLGSTSPGTEAGPEPDQEEHTDEPLAGEAEETAVEPGATVPGADDAEGPESAAGGAEWSAREVLRRADLGELDPARLREAERALGRLGRRLPRRMARRLRQGAGPGELDRRATLRRSMRTEAHPLHLHWRMPHLRPRPVIFLIDVSGSMEAYARPLVAYARGARQASKQVEVFTFGTRLTRLTGALDRRRLEDALEAVSASIPDWAGGTRIGASLEAFHRRWGRRGMARGAAVVIASDGWERGDVGTLRRAMASIRATAHSVLWVNPLAGDPDYEPLAAGMATALPYVDIFLPAQTYDDLERLAERLEQLPPRRMRRSPERADRRPSRPNLLEV